MIKLQIQKNPRKGACIVGLVNGPEISGQDVSIINDTNGLSSFGNSLDYKNTNITELRSYMNNIGDSIGFFPAYQAYQTNFLSNFAAYPSVDDEEITSDFVAGTINGYLDIDKMIVARTELGDITFSTPITTDGTSIYLLSITGKNYSNKYTSSVKINIEDLDGTERTIDFDSDFGTYVYAFIGNISTLTVTVEDGNAVYISDISVRKVNDYIALVKDVTWADDGLVLDTSQIKVYGLSSLSTTGFAVNTKYTKTSGSTNYLSYYGDLSSDKGFRLYDTTSGGTDTHHFTIETDDLTRTSPDSAMVRKVLSGIYGNGKQYTRINSDETENSFTHSDLTVTGNMYIGTAINSGLGSNYELTGILYGFLFVNTDSAKTFNQLYNDTEYWLTQRFNLV